MADNKINFKLASRFDGEGFTKASQAIKENTKEINSAREGLGKLTSAFKEVSPQASKATEWVGSFCKAFTTGGILGGSISLALQGVAEGVKKVSEHMAEAKKRTEAWATAIKDGLLDSIGQAKDDTLGLADEVKQLNADMKDALSVLNGDAAREANMKVLDNHQKMLDELAANTAAGGEAVITAAANLNETIIKGDLKVEQMNNTIDSIKASIAAMQAKDEEMAGRLQDAKTKQAELVEASNEYLAKRKALDDAIYNAEELFKEGHTDLATVIKARKDYALKIKVLETQYASTIEKLKAAEDDVAGIQKSRSDLAKNIKDAEQKLETAEQDLEYVTKERKTKINEANAKLDEAKQAQQELIDAEKQAAMDFDNFLNNQLNKLNESTDYLADANMALADIEKVITGKMEDISNGNGSPTSSGSTGEQRVKVVNTKDFPGHGGTSITNEEIKDIPKPRKLDNEVWDHFKDKRASVEEILAVKRFQKMEDRYGKTELFQVYRDTQKWLKILDSPNKMTERDKEFKTTFEKEVLPQFSKDMIKEMIGDASQKLLTTKRMDEVLKQYMDDTGPLAEKVKALTDKVDTAAIADNIKNQTETIREALVVN